MKKLFFLITLILGISDTNAQSKKKSDSTIIADEFTDTILNPGVRMQTEVFILDTKEPTQLSIVKKYDDNRTIKKARIRKLSVDVNKFSAFKIIHINPLRYNYFINDELVTNFFDAAAEAGRGLSVGNGNPADIGILPMISNSPASINFKTEYNDIKSKLKKADENRNRISVQYWSVEDEMQALKDPRGKPLKSKIKQYNDLEQKLMTLQISSDSIAAEVERLTKEALNILNVQNDKSYEILKNLRDLIADKTNFKQVPYLPKNQICDAINKLINENDLMDSVLDLSLTLLTYKRSYELNKSRNVNNDWNALQYFLKKINFRSGDFINNINREDKKNIANAIVEINEFVLLKKIKDLEDFYLNTYMQLGNQLQKMYFEFSRKINEYTGKAYISKSNMDHIQYEREELASIFSFIQSINNSLRIIARSLNIEDIRFGYLATDINTNYIKLLVHLKKLDYLSANNAVEYSLPTHNNLRNIDLIRYKIDRVDKTNGSNTQQTFPYDIWLRGGIKIDFSVGIMGTGLVDQEFSKVQYYKADGALSTDSLSLIIKDKGAFNFAFGGMINIYRRNGANWLNWGGSIGIVYSTNQKLQFLAGPTIHCGKTERIIIHGGVAMGFRQSLDKSQLLFDEKIKDKNYIVKGEYGNFNIPTVERFTIKPFVGISYNLSKKNALQAVSSQPGKQYYNSELPAN